MKVLVIPILKGQILKIRKGSYDTQTNTLRIRSLFSRVKETYTVEPDHLFIYKRKGCFIVDVNSRRSVSQKLESEPNVQISNRLDYLSERAFWQALLSKQKMSLGQILLMILAGGGTVYLIRIALHAFGLYVP